MSENNSVYSTDLRSLALSSSLLAVRYSYCLPKAAVSTVCISIALLLNPLVQMSCLVLPLPEKWKVCLLSKSKEIVAISTFLLFLESLLLILSGVWSATWTLIYSIFILLFFNGQISFPPEQVTWVVLGGLASSLLSRVLSSLTLFSSTTVKSEDKSKPPESNSSLIASFLVGSAVTHLAYSPMTQQLVKEATVLLRKEIDMRREEEDALFDSDSEGE
ncbi:hypothetical protein [Candidatus Similichlamydia epinepheli]|uniref:hypothetical protein n=1 Tax=Candidatus Similichlamydia epinepheli TaxID=1903953 RepID=UPI000D3432A1|nr:hypothetical protein [Candidatus Similichlamydia epinepheli]